MGHFEAVEIWGKREEEREKKERNGENTLFPR